ncbi:MAG: GNAT family N-acetyltransferase [Candidatus Bathyarchaeota archaeon]|nr:GNAT family N-acetyltransferase [Candidatus Bathyarchaeota archaeon]
MLNIRRFVKGVDESAWVEVSNAAYREYGSWWRGVSIEEMREREKRPNFDFEGRFIAELDGKPVGVVHAYVSMHDKLSKEKKGYIDSFCVIPAFRGRGVEEQLLEAAMNELRKRGMTLIQTWTGIKREDRIQLLEKQDFVFAYRTIDMEINLADIPSNIGENTTVAIRSLQKDVEEDIEMLNWLINECFKEDPLRRPRTVEETRHSVLNHPQLKEQETFFAALDQKNVGYVGIGIDEKYNIKQSAKSGRINGIGVLKAYRRKGIGTRLMLQGLKALRAKEMTKAMLDTTDINPTRAITLYEKIGFKVLQEYVTYEKHIT